MIDPIKFALEILEAPELDLMKVGILCDVIEVHPNPSDCFPLYNPENESYFDPQLFVDRIRGELDLIEYYKEVPEHPATQDMYTAINHYLRRSLRDELRVFCGGQPGDDSYPDIDGAKAHSGY